MKSLFALRIDGIFPPVRSQPIGFIPFLGVFLFQFFEKVATDLYCGDTG
ncbi:MAG TPA: hypothetical protein VGB26_07180 [Nitrospiria bacterium]